MNTGRAIDAVRPTVSLQSVATVFVLTVAVTASELLLLLGRVRYAIWAYSLLLVGLSLAPLLLKEEMSVVQAFALIPTFRLVNLTMPIFVDLTLFWLPLVYGPFVPVVLYLGRKTTVDGPQRTMGADVEAVELGAELPWWLGGTRGGKLRWLLRRGWTGLEPPGDATVVRSIFHWIARGLFVALVTLATVALFVLTVYLAEIEYDIITPAPLVPSLDASQIVVLTVMMVVFVGFVEELIFRGILQKVLERRLGLVPGLLLASGIFALVHSGYGVQTEVAFAGGIGLLFGIIYDITDSLLLVAVMHGLLNVFVFGIIPLDGGSSIDLLQALLGQLPSGLLL